MRLGLVARSENRGLGLQTWEFARHLEPDVVLLVSLGDEGEYPEHPERFPGAITATLDDQGRLPLDAMRSFVAQCDVFYTAETPYDFRLLQIARLENVRSVVQGNFEFMRWITEPSLPAPDLFLAPSTWHLEKWPTPTRYLPFPVDRERLPFRRRVGDAHTFLHVAGHRAMQDRNGTRIVQSALRQIGEPCDVIIRSQSPVSGSVYRTAERTSTPARVRIEEADIDDYWRLYDDADVLLAPRRFGGQSLVINEALSCGMPVLTLDVEPQRSYMPPECLIPARIHRMFQTPGGRVARYDAEGRHLAHRINEFARTPGLVQRMSREADRIAEGLSWDVLGPRYKEAFQSLLR